MNLDFHIRRAIPDDALGIHNAHMQSIQHVCSKDYSPQEIAAWGGRQFNKSKWKNAITSDQVWVVIADHTIHGFAHLRLLESEGVPMGYIHGLYLTPSSIGRGLGYTLARHMIEACEDTQVQRLSLHSTITAHRFYQSLGFVDDGPQMTINIAGQPIRSFPMTMVVNPSS